MGVLALVVGLMPGNNENSTSLGNASLLKMIRLLRMTRVARIARLLRLVPELMILIKGAAVASRSVLFTLILLIMVIYVFAIAFTELLADLPAGKAHFSSVHYSMATLLLNGVFLENCPDVVKDLGQDGLWYAGLFLLFILVATLTVMNMLIGVLVEVVGIVSDVEKEKLQVGFVKDRLQLMLAEFGTDEDGDGLLSYNEFLRLLEK